MAYGLITFGNKHASASSILAYTALQPVATALLSWVLVVAGPGKKYNLAEPGENALGGIAVLIGLALIIYDISTAEAAAGRGTKEEKEGLLTGQIQNGR